MKGFIKFLEDNYTIIRRDKKDYIAIKDVVKAFKLYNSTNSSKDTQCPECGSYMVTSTKGSNSCMTCQNIF